MSLKLFFKKSHKFCMALMSHRSKGMIQRNLFLAGKAPENNKNDDKCYFACIFINNAFDRKLSDSCSHFLKSLSQCFDECLGFQKIKMISTARTLHVCGST